MAMISTWWYALVFICALPLSVWLLASILGVLDRRPIITPLIQTLTTGVFITLFLLLTHRSFLSPLAAAFAVVTLLHLISGAALRRSLGISTYTSEAKLENDPQETHNLWDVPAHAAQRARLAERLTHLLTAQMDESPLSDRLA